MNTASINRKPAHTRGKDVWLCYAANDPDTLADTLHALYYLPERYKLIIQPSGDQSLSTAQDDIKHRVFIESDAEKTASSIQIGIHSNHRPTSADKKPVVIVTKPGQKDIASNEWHGFTVPAGSPEALASAILKIARTA